MPAATDLEHARRWLHRHRLGDIEPTPLLVTRLAARRGGLRTEMITYGAVLAAWVTLSIVERRTSEPAGADADVRSLAWFIGSILALILAGGVGILHQRRVERPLLTSRRVRSAHPAAAGAVRVLGRPRVAAAIVVYGGGLLLGALTAIVAERPADRSLALVFLLGLAVLAGLGGLLLAAVLRRPAVAEDADSLRVDDALRTEDAIRAAAPYPVVVALVGAVNTSIGSLAIWSFSGYAALCVLAWLLAERRVAKAPAPAVTA